MSLEAFNAGCNVIGVRKNDKNYGMCCAWAQMVDFDKITMLLGSQSITGKILAKGDLVGVSALASTQKDIALKLGEGHSGEADKFVKVKHRNEEGALLIEGAKVTMKCSVVSVLHLPGIENDAFVLLKVLKYEQNPALAFLGAYDF
jgi:flavin reductase (DIM6/NTAB) family NADH-FMN oxidoreductase RutF